MNPCSFAQRAISARLHSPVAHNSNDRYAFDSKISSENAEIHNEQNQLLDLTVEMGTVSRRYEFCRQYLAEQYGYIF